MRALCQIFFLRFRAKSITINLYRSKRPAVFAQFQTGRQTAGLCFNAKTFSGKKLTRIRCIRNTAGMQERIRDVSFMGKNF